MELLTPKWITNSYMFEQEMWLLSIYDCVSILRTTVSFFFFPLAYLYRCFTPSLLSCDARTLWWWKLWRIGAKGPYISGEKGMNWSKAVPNIGIKCYESVSFITSLNSAQICLDISILCIYIMLDNVVKHKRIWWNL